MEQHLPEKRARAARQDAKRSAADRDVDDLRDLGDAPAEWDPYDHGELGLSGDDDHHEYMDLDGHTTNREDSPHPQRVVIKLKNLFKNVNFSFIFTTLFILYNILT